VDIAETITAPEDGDLLETALAQFNEISSATRDERMMAIEDRRFLFVQGAQWEGDWGQQFENCLRVQINKVQRGHDKIINDYRANRFAVNYRSVGDDGDDDTAELLNGLMYADIYRSKGAQALDNAFGEGSSGGFGAWRLMNEYEDESDPDNDHQRIGVYQIVDADQRVFFDLDAKLYDKSDARFAYILHSMTLAAFKREFGEDAQTSWPENRSRPNWFDWFRPSVIYVAEYFEVEWQVQELRIYSRAQTEEEFRYWAKDMTDEMVTDLDKRGFTVVKRRIKRKRIHKYKLSGAEVLEDCGYIAGDRIPIVPFYGKRVFIDNVERFKGHVRDAKDPARIYNAQMSKLMETSSLSPREVPIFAPEQMEGLTSHWERMNIDRSPYALAHPVIDPQTGSIVQNGPIGMIQPPQVPPVTAALIQQTGADIAEITNGDDTSMEVKSNVSAESMDIAASRVDAKSYIYMDNFKGSMQCFGEVYYSMAKEVYVEEGREVEVMDEEGATNRAVLHELHTNPATGVAAKRYDLSVGKFKVIADVTEATATRRDKTVRTMMTLAQAAQAVQDPQIGQAALLTAIKNMDGEGMDDFKAFTHKTAVALGLDEMTPEEKQAAQNQQQQPDPQAQVLDAQTKALTAQAGKFEADTAQSKAKTVLTLAQAHKTNIEAHAPDMGTQHVNNLMRPAA
jgi:hypothetical protein